MRSSTGHCLFVFDRLILLDVSFYHLVNNCYRQVGRCGTSQPPQSYPCDRGGTQHGWKHGDAGANGPVGKTTTLKSVNYAVSFHFFQERIHLEKDSGIFSLPPTLFRNRSTMEFQTENKPNLSVHGNLQLKMTKGVEPQMPQDDGKHSHSSNQCGYTSNKATNLKTHMLIHSGEKPFVCKQCNYSCTQGGTLKRHIRSHSGKKPFICNQCQFSCTTSSNLKQHLQIHSGEKSFSCTQCNYSCNQAYRLKTHMRTHSGEKPFRCEQCNYSCTRASTLKTHVFIHTGEKPFSCNQCNYSCSDSSAMKYHMLSHTGEKPFACKQCNYSCKQSGQLKRHIKKHSAKINI